MMGMFKRTPKSVLYISARGMLTISIENGTPVSLDAFISEVESEDPDSAGIPSVTEFEQWLIERKNHRVEVLVDSVDEQQHLEILPPLSLGDRHALIQRKLTQRFRDADFTTYKLKRIREDGKRKTSALLMALRGEEHFKPWLDLLVKHRIRVDSLTSPTLLTEPLVDTFRPGGSGLLVSLNPAGLRQTVVIDGRVRFSRLATLSTDEAPEIQSEITRTLQYLLMSQRINRDEIRGGEFEVWMIDTGFDQQIGIAQTLFIDQGATVTVRIVDPAQMGIPVLAGQTGLSLWLQVPGRRKVKDYRTLTLGRFARLAAMRRVLWSGSAATAVAGILGLLTVDSLIRTQLPDTSRQRALLTQYERIGNDLTEQLASYPVSAREMEATVLFANRARERTVLPWAVLRAVGNGMSDDPGIRIDRLHWTSDDEANGSQGAASPGLMNSAQASAQPEPDLTNITIQGAVDPTWPKERANDEVMAIASRIAGQCSCEPGEVKLPYDPSPTVGIAQDYVDNAVKWRPYKITLQAAADSPIRFHAESTP